MNNNPPTPRRPARVELVFVCVHPRKIGGRIEFSSGRAGKQGLNGRVGPYTHLAQGRFAGCLRPAGRSRFATPRSDRPRPTCPTDQSGTNQMRGEGIYL
eukprot:9503920-Pyramimonas_sp.AAC.2